MNKPFLEIAPWLIVVFKKAYEIDENVSTEHVCVLKGRFLHKELKIIGKKFRLITPANYELTYIDNL